MNKGYFSLVSGLASMRNSIDKELDKINKVPKIKRGRLLTKEEIHKKKVRRNEPCPCDSGKKYKYCCGRNK